MVFCFQSSPLLSADSTSAIAMITSLPCMCARSLQSCPALCNPMDCSPPGSSVHDILQASILEWVAISLSRGSSWPRDGTHVSWIAGRFFTIGALRKAHLLTLSLLYFKGSKGSVKLTLSSLPAILPPSEIFSILNTSSTTLSLIVSFVSLGSSFE